MLGSGITEFASSTSVPVGFITALIRWWQNGQTTATDSEFADAILVDIGIVD